MKVSRLDTLALGLSGGSLALTAALYSRLPLRIPTHFDAHGTVNGWMERSVGAWMAPAVGLATWALLRFAPVILPRAWSVRLAGAPVAAAAALVVMLTGAMQVIVLYASLHPAETVGRPLLLALGAFWVALAQVLPRVRRNPLLGIRTVWTLTSDENWLRTHRLAGYTFSAAGLVTLGAGVVGGAALFTVAVGALIASAVAPVIYSYVLAERLPPEA